MNKIIVKYLDQEYEYPMGISFLDISKDFADQFDNDILLVKYNNKLRELWKTAKCDGNIEFYTASSSIGSEVYRRSLTFLMVKSLFDAMGHDNVKTVRVLHSIGSGYYCVAEGNFEINNDFLIKVKNRMDEIVSKKLEITKNSKHLADALCDFKEFGMTDKERLFRYRNSSSVNLYSINEFEDYYYGFMVPNTGYLKYYDLKLYDNGFVLEFPTMLEPKKIPSFNPSTKLFETNKTATKWADMLGIRTVGDLNNAVVDGSINDLILVQEAIHEKIIADIARQIADNNQIKFVLIAGPSSSSKTSFSHRLSIQLRTMGLIPHPIACDNYFVDRELTPRDENGNYDFECLEAMDIELLNKQLEDMLEGKEVNLPTYNFTKGVKEYLGNTLKLGDHDILVLEGIHCLNDKLTYKLDSNFKYKIYVSALNQLCIDDHNRVPSTDGRLIRRMIRDARTRGANAYDTIKMWPNVRKGEELYIFPYQDSADVIFNSAAIYELAVFKQYCVPLLYSVPEDTPEYIEANRLRKFLDYFVGIDDKYIPSNSLIKEFIGGSIFPVG